MTYFHIKEIELMYRTVIKKIFIFLLTGLLYNGSSQLMAQTVYVMGAATGTNGATADALNGTTVTLDCGTTNVFRDPGGASGNYSNNQLITVTFCSNGSNPLYFDFRASASSLNLDAGTGDTLFFYDGTSNALIATLTQSDDYAFSTPSVGTSSTCVKVVWKSDGSGVDGGWDGTINCTALPVCSTNVPASDIFGQAPAICNFNNYCGRTDSYYGEDAPYNFSGTGGGCPAADGLFGGTLENNSWLKFEAAATTATFNFNVTGGGSCTGLQAGVFGFDNVSKTFTLKSACAQTNGSGLGTGSSVLTATGLTIGETYYLMMDGTAGSICDYTINAGTGVAAVDAGPNQSICSTTATLTAGSTYPTGNWTVVSGSGNFTNATNYTTTVTGLTPGINVFKWTITTAGCGTIFDTVQIDASCALPVNLVSFTGHCWSNNSIRLQWKTASETRHSRFIVERAADAIQFNELQSIYSTGNSTLPKQYEYTDASPFKGTNYYRLKQVDEDGNIKLFNVVAVQSCTNRKGLSAFIQNSPRGTDRIVQFNLENDGQVEAVLISQTGVPVAKPKNLNGHFGKGIHQAALSTSQFLPGLYFLKLSDGKETIVEKLVIQ